MEVQKGIYRHFKGHEYKVIGVARHSETLEELVVYINVHDDDDIWIRPIEMFFEEVSRNGESFQRFTLIKKT